MNSKNSVMHMSKSIPWIQTSYEVYMCWINLSEALRDWVYVELEHHLKIILDIYYLELICAI